MGGVVITILSINNGVVITNLSNNKVGVGITILVTKRKV